MILLDTDHINVLQSQGPRATALAANMAASADQDSAGKKKGTGVVSGYGTTAGKADGGNTVRHESCACISAAFGTRLASPFLAIAWFLQIGRSA